MCELPRSQNTNFLHKKDKLRELEKSSSTLVPSIKEPLKLDFMQLPSYLRYAYIGNDSTASVIISSSLTDMKEEKLL